MQPTPQPQPEKDSKDPDAGMPAEWTAWNLGKPTPEELSRTRCDLNRFLEGDEAAFAVLWDRFRPAIDIHLRARARSRVAEARLRARFEAEFEDLVQEVAVTVCRRLPSFEYREPGSLLAWICGIATNHLNDWIDHWKAGKRTPRIERSLAERRSKILSSLGSLGSAIPSPSMGPCTNAENSERRRKIADALGELPERFHQIVILRIFADATWEDIAKEVGSPSADAVRMEFAGKVLPAVRRALASTARAE
jgi:RNA polymerase sigma factor (sigma-70 family)